MSDYIDTREGWREGRADKAIYPYLVQFNSEGIGRYWVREEPVPPLPTEPYTVIYTTGAKGYSDWALVRRVSEDWAELAKGSVFTDEQLLRCITGFEVLSEPRAVTAKTVIDYIRMDENVYDIDEEALTRASREFGVES